MHTKKNIGQAGLETKHLQHRCKTEKTKHIMLFAGARAGKITSKMWGWITDCFIRLIALQMQRKLLSILHLIFGKCGLLVHLARWIFHSTESTHTAIIRWFQAKAISGRLYGRASTSPGSLPPPPPCFLPTSQDRVKTTPPCQAYLLFFRPLVRPHPHWCFETGGCINTA